MSARPIRAGPSSDTTSSKVVQDSKEEESEDRSSDSFLRPPSVVTRAEFDQRAPALSRTLSDFLSANHEKWMQVWGELRQTQTRLNDAVDKARAGSKSDSAALHANWELRGLIANIDRTPASDRFEEFKRWSKAALASAPRRWEQMQTLFKAFEMVQDDAESSDQGDDFDHEVSSPRQGEADAGEDESADPSPKRGQKRESGGQIKSVSAAKSGRPVQPIVVDAQGVARLEHVDLADETKRAYLEICQTEPWAHFAESCQSFLPGLTPAQRDWNRALKEFWRKHAKTIWSRYFWVGCGHYKDPAYQVDSSANHPKSQLGRAKRDWSSLVLQLYRLEGQRVFEYLFSNPHPFWAELTQEPCSLKSLETARGPAVVIEYLKQCGLRRWPDFTKYPDLMPRTKFNQYSQSPGVEANVHRNWSWDWLTWAHDQLPRDYLWCPALFESAHDGSWSKRTSPFPYVKFDCQGVFEQPPWLKHQNTKERNQGAMYLSRPNHQTVVKLDDQTEVQGSDVLGPALGVSPSSAITL
ncbi:hypothetical protein DYB32_009781 [Aphanomyces invadans]|uniref:Uncharacterized protein n=1 Tax=Aphanomyces invadans TaxID=157072 RepID=A0A3R6Y119_9STRA|nr:hypothetical protein DYB32_009781 [Aphanomyces invadans]